MFKFVYFIHYHYLCVLYYIHAIIYQYCYLCNHHALDIMTPYEVLEICISRESKFNYNNAWLNCFYGTWQIGIIYNLYCYDYRE